MATAKKSSTPANRRVAPPANVRRPAPQAAPAQRQASVAQGANGGDKLKKIGALWSGMSQSSGKRYMSGLIEGIGRVVVFKNTYKETDNQPDLIIYLSREAADQKHAYEGTPAEAAGEPELDDIFT